MQPTLLNACCCCRLNVAVAQALSLEYDLPGSDDSNPSSVQPPPPVPSSSSSSPASTFPSPLSTVPNPSLDAIVPSLTPSLKAAFSASTFHTVNVLLHAAVTAAYVGVLQRVGVGAWVCLGAGLLFATHPVHVEAVAGVVGRAELLAALAFCLALAAYIKYLHGHPSGRAWARRPSCCGHSSVCCEEGQTHHHKSLTCSSLPWGGAKGRWWVQMPPWGWLMMSVAAAGLAMACKEQGVTALGVGLLLHAAAVFTTTPMNKVSSQFSSPLLECSLHALFSLLNMLTEHLHYDSLIPNH